MELNGKCKEEFEKWLLLQDPKYCDYAIENDDNTGIPTYEGRYFHYVDFEHYPDAMKFGVYQDFFDANGIFIQVLFYDFDSHNWQIFIECEKESYDYTETHLTTRSEANSQAIKTANNLFNEQWKKK